MNLFTLARRNLSHRPLSTLLSLLVFAFGIAVIVTLLLFTQQLKQDLERNLAGIDLVVGAKGSPMQLILSSVFHLDIPTGNIALAEAEKLKKNRLVKQAIPLAMGDSFHGFRIIGTVPDYLTHYHADLQTGRLWQHEMEAVIGADVAKRFPDLTLGKTFSGSHGLTDGGETHGDFPYTVVGILKPTGSVVDRLVLTGVESVWHIHEHHHHHDADDDEEDEHGGREVTSLLIRYASPMAAASLPRLVNQSTSMQAASPAFETARLLRLVGVGSDVLATGGWFLLAIAGLSIFASLMQTMQERRYDIALLRTLGASPLQLMALLLLEGMSIAFFGALLGIAFGYIGMCMLASWVKAAHQVVMPPVSFDPALLWLLVAALGIGFIASLIPSWQAYRMDIAKTLSRG